MESSFKNLELNNNLSFDELLPKILDKNTIMITSKLLIKHNIDKKYTRTFLSMYMIKYNPSDIFSVITNIENKLIDLADKVLSTFNILLDEPNNIHVSKLFVSRFNIFCEFFNGWKKKDKEMLLKILAHSYWELNETSKYIEDNPIWNTEIEKQKQLLESQANKIDSNGSQFIKNYNPPNAHILDDEEIKQIAEKAYWDSYQEELDNNNHNRTLKLLTEIRDRLKNITPNRKDLHIELNEKLDIKLIHREIINNAIDDNIIISIIYFIFEKLQQLQSQEDDNSLLKFKEEIGGKSLAYIFKNVFKRIDKIEDDIKEFYKFMSKKQ